MRTRMRMRMRVLRCGEGAALVELDGLPEVLGLYAALSADPPPGTGGLVPAARTLLVRHDPAVLTFEALRAELAVRAGGPVHLRDGGQVEVPVRYDGEDLEEVAGLTGLPVREVVRRHAGGTYTCAFCGFAPGFAYLAGLDARLHVPRLPTPRTRVPAGAVAIAAEFTAVYPRESPGGWRILGHTGSRLWDLERDPPALLAPGTRVRFVEAGDG